MQFLILETHLFLMGQDSFSTNNTLITFVFYIYLSLPIVHLNLCSIKSVYSYGTDGVYIFFLFHMYCKVHNSHYATSKKIRTTSFASLSLRFIKISSCGIDKKNFYCLFISHFLVILSYIFYSRERMIKKK